MTGGNLKSRQKRLDSCVLARPKWTKIRETREKPTCGTLKIDDLAADAAVRVENVHENGQARGNTKILGKYQFPFLFRLNRFSFLKLTCDQGFFS